MKRWALLAIVFILLGFSGCIDKDKNDDQDSFFGTYSFEEVSYLSPLSSSSIGYVNDNMADSKFTITKKSFKADYNDVTFEVENPMYKKEEILASQSILDDVRKFIGNDIEYQYTIYNESENPTHWRLYTSLDSVWISTYADNTADGSNIIMHIYLLKKD